MLMLLLFVFVAICCLLLLMLFLLIVLLLFLLLFVLMWLLVLLLVFYLLLFLLIMFVFNPDYDEVDGNGVLQFDDCLIVSAAILRLLRPAISEINVILEHYNDATYSLK